ncbi:MAG: universal stress protein [Deltaproteobacteria bacterium]|nr:universal stress protein [Deltaproteobacteria bacterium]
MKIFVCYDGSREADAAIEEAARFAGRFGGTVTVATSIRAEEGPDAAPARTGLERAKALLERAGVPCQARLLARGLYPGEDLVLCASEEQSDLVVVGVKNRSKLGKLVLGSVTQYVMLNARCPVLGVK